VKRLSHEIIIGNALVLENPDFLSFLFIQYQEFFLRGTEC
jgi:hypothetical protein